MIETQITYSIIKCARSIPHPFSPHFNYAEIGSRTENFEMMGDIKRMRFSWKWLTIEILY